MSDNMPGQFDFTKSSGWVCPKCKAVMAPTYPTCFYCKPQQTAYDQLLDATNMIGE